MPWWGWALIAVAVIAAVTAAGWIWSTRKITKLPCDYVRPVSGRGNEAWSGYKTSASATADSANLIAAASTRATAAATGQLRNYSCIDPNCPTKTLTGFQFNPGTPVVTNHFWHPGWRISVDYAWSARVVCQ